MKWEVTYTKKENCAKPIIIIVNKYLFLKCQDLFKKSEEEISDNF